MDGQYIHVSDVSRMGSGDGNDSDIVSKKMKKYINMLNNDDGGDDNFNTDIYEDDDKRVPKKRKKIYNMKSSDDEDDDDEEDEDDDDDDEEEEEEEEDEYEDGDDDNNDDEEKDNEDEDKEDDENEVTHSKKRKKSLTNSEATTSKKIKKGTVKNEKKNKSKINDCENNKKKKVTNKKVVEKPIKGKTNIDEKSNKKKRQEKIEKKKLKTDKKFYNQILYQIKRNEEFSGENKKKILIGTNMKSDINDINEIEYEEYLKLNFYHQKNGKMICTEKPPPIKHKYLFNIFETILEHFSTNGLTDEIRVFLKEFKKRYKEREKMYYIFLTYFYGFESYLYHNLTGNTFPHPEDPLIDFSRDSIPIHQITLNKRNNQKFNIKNDEKRYALLKQLISVVVKKDMKNSSMEEMIKSDGFDYFIVCDIKKTLNHNDPKISQNSAIAGLVFCISFLCDVILFGCRRLMFRVEKM